MAKSKIDFILLLLATLCCSMAHAQKQVSAELRDSTESGSDIIKIVGNHSSKGAVNNALDILSGQAAGVNVTSNGLDRMASSIACGCVVRHPLSVAMIPWC